MRKEPTFQQHRERHSLDLGYATCVKRLVHPHKHITRLKTMLTK